MINIWKNLDFIEKTSSSSWFLFPDIHLAFGKSLLITGYLEAQLEVLTRCYPKQLSQCSTWGRLSFFHEAFTAFPLWTLGRKKKIRKTGMPFIVPSNILLMSAVQTAFEGFYALNKPKNIIIFLHQSNAQDKRTVVRKIKYIYVLWPDHYFHWVTFILC